MFKVLKRFNFGQRMMKWLEILFKKTKSSIVTNGYQSRYFWVTRGTRQGDSLSSSIYVLQNEPFLARIRKNQLVEGIVLGPPENRQEIKVAGFVDDTTALLNNRSSLENFFSDVVKFEKVSGSKLNREKTIGLVSCPEKETVVQGVKLIYGNDELLGAPVGAKINTQSIWDGLVKKM